MCYHLVASCLCLLSATMFQGKRVWGVINTFQWFVPRLHVSMWHPCWQYVLHSIWSYHAPYFTCCCVHYDSCSEQLKGWICKTHFNKIPVHCICTEFNAQKNFPTYSKSRNTWYVRLSGRPGCNTGGGVQIEPKPLAQYKLEGEWKISNQLHKCRLTCAHTNTKLLPWCTESTCLSTNLNSRLR